MNNPSASLPGGTWVLGDLTVNRFGYGAMQLAGPWVMGPPADRDGALAVLRDAVDLGITHIDTADAYGPHITNQLIREALHPYRDSLHIVTKIGATRDEEGGWPPGRRPGELRRAVRENLENLGLETLDVVNLRLGDARGPVTGSLAESFEALVELQRQGLIRHLVSGTPAGERRGCGALALLRGSRRAGQDRPLAPGFADAPSRPPKGATADRIVPLPLGWQRRELAPKRVGRSRARSPDSVLQEPFSTGLPDGLSAVSGSR